MAQNHSGSTGIDARTMTEAAQAFLTTLKPDQLSQTIFSFDVAERSTWHYAPMPWFKGLARRDMTGVQLEAGDALIRSSTSERAFRQVKAIFELETILGDIEQRAGVITHERDPGLYFFSIFGDPSSDKAWGWRVDGHHVCLNFVVFDKEIIAMTPFFLGSNPAEILHGPKNGNRILVDEENIARKLLLTLDESQRGRAAIYPCVPGELFTRASRKVEIATPSGVSASTMSADQREILMSLIKAYVSRASGPFEKTAFDRVNRDGVEQIHFAWVGSEHRRQPHYYRIQGPNFFVEYDNTQNNANHIHSVWRDISSDFGFDLLAEHYRHAHTTSH